MKEPLTIVVDAESLPAVTFDQLRQQAAGFDGVAVPFDPVGRITRCNAALTDPAKIVRQLGGLKIVTLTTTPPGLPAAVDCAAAIGCPVVRVIDPAADQVRAAAGRVDLAVELTTGRDRVARLWHLVDEIHHPTVGACWTVDGDPAVAVPTLASILSVVRLNPSVDTTATAMHRLRGIGYTGPLVVFGVVDTAAVDRIRPKAIPSRANG